MNKYFLGIPLIVLIVGFGYIRMHAKSSVSQLKRATSVQVEDQNASSSATVSSRISLATIATHVKEGDCWTAIDGIVYDISSFTGKHPGGPGIMAVCGKDGSDIFAGQHGEREKTRMAPMKIGTLEKN